MKADNTDARDQVLAEIEAVGWLSTDDCVEILTTLYLVLDEVGFTDADIDSIAPRAWSRLIRERSKTDV